MEVPVVSPAQSLERLQGQARRICLIPLIYWVALLVDGLQQWRQALLALLGGIGRLGAEKQQIAHQHIGRQLCALGIAGIEGQQA